jgi:hypothetical protein
LKHNKETFWRPKENLTISEPQYKVEKIRLETELTKEKIKLSDTEARARNWTNLTENVVHYARLASEVFIDINTPNQIKREILSSLGLNHRIETKKLFIDLHGWFSVLKKGENELIPQIEALERDKTLTPERRKEAFASFRTKLCAGKDLNLRSPKATDLQSVVIDRSTTDAGPRHKIGCGTIVPYLRKNSRYH